MVTRNRISRRTGYLRELLASGELLTNLTLREIRGKYQRTFFGQLWSLANPIASVLIYTFVFAFILRIHPEPGDPSGLDVFALWLLCGLLPWQFVHAAIRQGMSSLVSNAGLIQKVYFPRIVLPLSMIGAAGFTWLFEMAVLVAALSLFGVFVLPWLPLVMLQMVLLSLFAAGIAMALATANVYFRDTEHFAAIGLQIWMYLTPIIYPFRLVEEASAQLGGLLGTSVTVSDLYLLNPMTHFVEVFRVLLYDGRWPDPASWLTCAIWAMVSFTAGVLVFRSRERRLAELL